MDNMLLTMYMVPLLIVGIKIGILFSLWGLVITSSRLVVACTKYVNTKTFNEARK